MKVYNKGEIMATKGPNSPKVLDLAAMMLTATVFALMAYYLLKF